MTPPRPLTLVDQTPDNPHAASALRQWDAESQLVGALMHLTATHVAPILELVPDRAIWRPDNRWAYEVIRDIVARGDDPDPVMVLHTARHRPAADAAHPGDPVSAARHHQFAIHLANLYTQTVTPAAARHYARDILEDAYRREVELHGNRMAELAQTGASRAELAAAVTAMHTTLADWWRRIEDAAAQHAPKPVGGHR